MSTVEKTRSRVSYRSWVKAQRKEAAKAYKTPNRRADHYNALYFAARYKGYMKEAKVNLFESDRPNAIKIWFDSFLYNRNKYRRSIAESKSWNKPFPLP